ncbi:aldose epimerase family protein [Clostridium butyricum]|jgi:aldose 1-epimerase|uniref:Aldose 1-epimerase n=1 Tax=Clostridium butyricum TaxID=1492 RepID=A0A6L9ERT0_CLOBU|nr:aldose epimerase family protein [Clostridium butyricum]MDU5820176.1 aldose epimerase family protein [Clostridium butyricum]NAS18991.1 galactose-1-epimerase [Clostridium butyricum]
MSISKNYYGNLEYNKTVYIYTLKNSNNMTIDILTYGGTLIYCKVPDKSGNLIDVLLGYDNLDSYLTGDKYFGALIGRFGNRIKHGKFNLNNKEYSLPINDGPNHLHGGHGYDKVIWNDEIKNDNCLKLSYFSKDGEEGYPGNLNISVEYTLTNDNSLEIHYLAVSDSDTIINLTNHSYFNLSGHDSGDILNQKLMINAKNFTVNDKFSIPTGEIRSVKNTPMDFLSLSIIGEKINDDYEQIDFGNGYDHNFVLDTDGDINKIAAHALSEDTGIVMDMYTTQPGVQFYSGNFLDGTDIGKNNIHYIKRSGFCLETQHFPNSINCDNFSSPILKANEKYEHTTIYKFSNL